jgi:hypothetical protein
LEHLESEIIQRKAEEEKLSSELVLPELPQKVGESSDQLALAVKHVAITEREVSSEESKKNEPVLSSD